MPQDRGAATSAPQIEVVLPRPLLELFPGAAERVHLTAPTVSEMITELDARWPGMRDRLCDSTPRIRRHLNIFVDGKRGKLETPLRPNITVYILTAMSGG
jgi:molybdopterin converting factor small subunit